MARDGIVVVSGGASGIGAALLPLLADDGYSVIALDRSPSDAAGPGRDIEIRAGDVSEESTWEALRREVNRRMTDRGQKLVGLVNAAGITYRARLGEVDRAEWDRIFAVNVTGAMTGIQHLAPLMGRGGAIVNIGSLAGLNGHYPVAYTASKWALRGLTHAAAQQYGPLGIRVNIVHPGFIETPMTASAPSAMRGAQLELTPLERTGDPEDVARTIRFLLSDEAGYITGAEIPVDGGASSSAGAKLIVDRLDAATRDT